MGTRIGALFVVFALATSSIALADPPQAPSSGAKVATETTKLAGPDDVASRDAAIQIALLKQEVASSKSYESSLLSTVYWSLGGVVTIAVLLVGFGWLGNFKIYERDKLALRSELQVSMNESISAAKDSLSREVSADVENKVQELTDKFKTRIDRLNSAVFEMRLATQKAEMEAEVSPSLALTSALELLEKCRIRAQDELPEIMKFMIEKIGQDGRLTAEEMTRVSAVLDMLPSHFNSVSQRLSNAMATSNMF